MRTLLAMLCSTVALAVTSENINITATDTGISAANLSATPLSSAIDMQGDGKITNQLSLTIAVTAGSSTRIQVTCYESSSKTASFAQISFCDNSSPSNCNPDVREFTLSEYTAVGGILYIPSRWGIKKQWAKCSVDDPDNGTGTVTLTGTRSWQ